MSDVSIPRLSFQTISENWTNYEEENAFFACGTSDHSLSDKITMFVDGKKDMQCL